MIFDDTPTNQPVLDKKQYDILEQSIAQLEEQIHLLSNALSTHSESNIEQFNQTYTAIEQSASDTITELKPLIEATEERITTLYQMIQSNFTTTNLQSTTATINSLIADTATIATLIGDIQSTNIQAKSITATDIQADTLTMSSFDIDTLVATVAKLATIQSQLVETDTVQATTITTAEMDTMAIHNNSVDRTPIQEGLMKMTIPNYKGVVVIKGTTYSITITNNTLVSWSMASTDFPLKRIDFTKNDFGKNTSTNIYLDNTAPYNAVFLGDTVGEITTEASEPVELNVSTVQGTMTSTAITMPDSDILISAYIVDEMPETMLPNSFYMVATEDNHTNGTWYFDGVQQYKIAPDSTDPVVNSITPTTIRDTNNESTGAQYDYLSNSSNGIEWKQRIHNDYTNANPNNLIDSSTLYNYDGKWSDGSKPITKLGDVDEGSWQAGDITAPNITASTSLHTPDIINWGNTTVQLSDIADYSWVEV